MIWRSTEDCRELNTAMKLTDEEIEKIIEQSLKELPAEFKEALENVVISVEDAYQSSQPHRKGPPQSGILIGLYHGVPKTHRSKRYGPVMPDYITIYKKSIERVARNKEEAKELLRKTLLHEIGHHLGLSEYDLRSKDF